MKKLFRVIRIAFLSAVLVFLCVAFYDYVTEKEGFEPSPFAQSSFMEFLPQEENVKTLGRTYYENGVRYLSYSGSGIEFIVRGKYCVIDIIGDNVQYQRDRHKARFAIYKNGVLLIDDIVTMEEKSYHIDINDYYNDTVITLVKLSEAKYSTFGVGTVAVESNEKIRPTGDKELKIEFIGDSITCGYGIDEENPDGYFSTATENFTGTYAYLTAKNLNADYSAVAFSGYGVYSGYSAGRGRNEEATVGRYYDTAAFLSDRDDPLWNFNDFQSDVVVINLGTNDASYCSGSYERRQGFISEYVSFLKQVRLYNAGAYIMCILGDMNNSLYSSIEKAVELYSEETGDTAVEALTIEYRMYINDIVIDGHPGYMSNVYASYCLSNAINSIMGVY